jgi:CDP-paratose 2-epimerase
MKRLGSNGGGKGADRVLITGGAGFIGSNLAHHLLCAGERVLIYDNFSRPGVEKNWKWLSAQHGDAVQLELGDVRNAESLRWAVKQARAIFHLAAQVAVTTSLEDPAHDFEVNAIGTLNLLNAWREQPNPAPLVYTSTNKVYGSLSGVTLRETQHRYEPADRVVRVQGINEAHPLEFYSPYGCSKGAADQYVLDHARTFGLPAVVFRMSCIYGPHQFGTEDQGWVAHFLIRAREGRPLVIYGDGKQVRDVLFVEDLVRAFCLARKNLPRLAGQVFNIGGGTERAVSLLELLEHINALEGRRPDVSFESWRPGDQRFYVTDTAKFRAATGWRPMVDVPDGLERLHRWLSVASAPPKSKILAAA